MNDPIIFSQIFGPLFILLGISMIINKKWYKKIIKDMQGENVSIFIFSIIGFIFGMYILALHSGFGNAHEIFATFIGVAITLKSSFYLLTPHVMNSLVKKLKPITKNIHYIGTLYLLIGIYISYIAYI